MIVLAGTAVFTKYRLDWIDVRWWLSEYRGILIGFMLTPG